MGQALMAALAGGSKQAEINPVQERQAEGQKKSNDASAGTTVTTESLSQLGRLIRDKEKLAKELGIGVITLTSYNFV